MKEKKSTNKKSLKEILKVAMQNKLRNFKMAKANKTDLAHFRKRQYGACSDLLIHMWWSLIIKYQGIGHQQFQMTLVYRCQ